MTIGWRRPVSLINARVVVPAGGSGRIALASRLRFASRILAIDEAPRRGDAVFDLENAFVLPGLINAHDHLELNHYGSIRPRPHYQNAADWVADLRPLLKSDAAIRRNMEMPLAARLLIGGVKNVLAGATTVAHHNPLYRELRRSFPVRVVRKYGWAHSFYLEGVPVGAGGERGANVVAAARRTPLTRPFIVHAAEGLDDRAEAELALLERARAVRPNTVLVHGVAMDNATWTRMMGAGASLAWCPASNMFLLGRTVPARHLLDADASGLDRICLGTDSRLTGSRDLLDELRVARDAGRVTPDELLRMVTTSAARALKLRHAATLAAGSPADLIVVPPLRDTAADSLLAASRSDLRLVVVDGRPTVGARGVAPVFDARGVSHAPLLVDDRERIADRKLAAAIARSPVPEPGVRCL
jgi:cytosine/adenosine deaminase-related metal-dependent hydrolase